MLYGAVFLLVSVLHVQLVKLLSHVLVFVTETVEFLLIVTDSVE